MRTLRRSELLWVERRGLTALTRCKGVSPKFPGSNPIYELSAALGLSAGAAFNELLETSLFTIALKLNGIHSSIIF